MVLREYFENNTGNCIHKWMHYLEIYEFWFQKYRNRPVVILEIGVYQGGSLQMWRNYFGKEAQIYGVDINPNCKRFEAENTHIFIGSQEDRQFLKDLKTKIPKVDILIDDGGHMMKQQITSFEELYDHIKEEGVYLCEDLHTSYYKSYGGGYRKQGSFVEYSKNLIDYLNAWHSKEKGFSVNNFTRTAYSMHYYDSVLVIQKKNMQRPQVRREGEIVIPLEEFPQPVPRRNRLIDLLLRIRKKLRYLKRT